MNHLAKNTSENERSLCKNQWVSLLGNSAFAHYQCVSPQITLTEGKRVIWSYTFQKWPHQCDQTLTNIIYKHTHVYRRSRKMVLMNLFAGQAKTQTERAGVWAEWGREGGRNQWQCRACPGTCEIGSWGAQLGALRRPRGAGRGAEVPGASVRNSAHGKGHEEGGFGTCKGGIEPQETPCSRASAPKTRVCLLYCFMLSPIPLTL